MPNPKRVVLPAIILSLGLWLSAARAEVVVSQLQCEYLTDPLGIDVQTPSLTWQLSDADHARGQKQAGYQVLVASSPALLDQGRADLWDSGQLLSAQSALVPFAGKKLTSGQDCYWKVRVLDKDQKVSAWSPIARFSMGLLEPKDWSGPWIKHPTAAKEKHLWFRKTFALGEKAASAFVYVATVGYHELYVNGQKVDPRVLAPSLTRLDTRVLYVTYDITHGAQGRGELHRHLDRSGLVPLRFLQDRAGAAGPTQRQDGRRRCHLAGVRHKLAMRRKLQRGSWRLPV